MLAQFWSQQLTMFQAVSFLNKPQTYPSALLFTLFPCLDVTATSVLSTLLIKMPNTLQGQGQMPQTPEKTVL